MAREHLAEIGWKWSTFAMAKKTSRRNFLCTAPVAAAVGFTLADSLMLAARAQTANTQSAAASPAPVPYMLLTAKDRVADVEALQAVPGNKNLVDASAGFPCAIVMTTEVAKSAKEYEWHEGRDHIVGILEGSTVYEVGGTPKNGRNTKPGEWLAPEAEGATKLSLKKGDMLTIPRGTLHRRSTAESVTFFLFSPSGSVKA